MIGNLKNVFIVEKNLQNIIKNRRGGYNGIRYYNSNTWLCYDGYNDLCIMENREKYLRDKSESKK